MRASASTACGGETNRFHVLLLHLGHLSLVNGELARLAVHVVRQCRQECFHLALLLLQKRDPPQQLLDALPLVAGLGGTRRDIPGRDVPGTNRPRGGRRLTSPLQPSSLELSLNQQPLIVVVPGKHRGLHRRPAPCRALVPRRYVSSVLLRLAFFGLERLSSSPSLLLLLLRLGRPSPRRLGILCAPRRLLALPEHLDQVIACPGAVLILAQAPDVLVLVGCLQRRVQHVHVLGPALGGLGQAPPKHLFRDEHLLEPPHQHQNGTSQGQEHLVCVFQRPVQFHHPFRSEQHLICVRA